MKSGKRILDIKKEINKSQELSLEEGIDKLKALSKVKFDESVEIAVRLGIDAKKTDQNIRGAIVLPNGTGKSVSVLVFAKDQKEIEAKEAGADFVGSDDLAEKIQGGWFGFDAVVATPDMMKVVGKLGKLLGTRGLMPNPKLGTVTPDVKKAVTELKAGKVEYRNDKAGNIHALVGKVSFDTNKIKENVFAFLDALNKAKPSATKGTYIKKVSLSTTMGPGLTIDRQSVKA